MVDMALDIRKGSADFGKIILYDIPARTDNDYAEWIWLPPGFAHGVFFTEDTLIEYFCTGQYNGQCEANISPLSSDIDWSLCDSDLKQLFDDFVSSQILITDKDKDGFSVSQWNEDERSDNFIYGEVNELSK